MLFSKTKEITIEFFVLFSVDLNTIWAMTWEENYKGNSDDLLTPIQNGECTIVPL